MSLPPTQERILTKIEGRLRVSDPQLSSRFVMFARLVRDEAMPWAEQIKPRPIADRLLPLRTFLRRTWHQPAARARALLVLPAALTAMMCALVIAAGFPSPHRGGTANTKPGVARELVVGKSRVCRLPQFRGALLAC
jgi:hypothetical protein